MCATNATEKLQFAEKAGIASILSKVAINFHDLAQLGLHLLQMILEKSKRTGIIRPSPAQAQALPISGIPRFPRPFELNKCVM